MLLYICCNEGTSDSFNAFLLSFSNVNLDLSLIYALKVVLEAYFLVFSRAHFPAVSYHTTPPGSHSPVI